MRTAYLVATFVTISSAIAIFTGAMASDQMLTGWGPYRFGMTVEQIRAVPGLAWSKGESQIESRSRVAVGSGVFGISLGITSRGLNYVELKQVTTVNRGDCERRFVDALDVTQKQHGALSGTTPLVASGGKSVTHHHNGRSTYSRWVFDSDTWLFNGGTSRTRATIWSASRRFGDRRVEIQTEHRTANVLVSFETNRIEVEKALTNGSGTCEVSITYGPFLEREELTGWGGYVFGMTPAEARGVSQAKAAASITGLPFAISVVFADGKLEAISLRYDAQGVSRDDCKQYFANTLATFEPRPGLIGIRFNAVQGKGWLRASRSNYGERVTETPAAAHADEGMHEHVMTLGAKRLYWDNHAIQIYAMHSRPTRILHGKRISLPEDAVQRARTCVIQVDLGATPLRAPFQVSSD